MNSPWESEKVGIALNSIRLMKGRAGFFIAHRHSPAHSAFSFRLSAISDIACKETTIEILPWKSDQIWTVHEWKEWRVKSLAAVLLMLRKAFMDAFRKVMMRNGFRQ